MNNDYTQQALKLAEAIRNGEEIVLPASMGADEYQIGEVAKEIGRSIHTIRVWGYDNRLPEHLRPTRNARGWRIWNWGQIQGIKQWMIDADMTPGKAFRRKDEHRD